MNIMGMILFGLAIAVLIKTGSVGKFIGFLIGNALIPAIFGGAGYLIGKSITKDPDHLLNTILLIIGLIIGVIQRISSYNKKVIVNKDFYLIYERIFKSFIFYKNIYQWEDYFSNFYSVNTLQYYFFLKTLINSITTYYKEDSNDTNYLWDSSKRKIQCVLKRFTLCLLPQLFIDTTWCVYGRQHQQCWVRTLCCQCIK